MLRGSSTAACVLGVVGATGVMATDVGDGGIGSQPPPPPADWCETIARWEAAGGTRERAGAGGCPVEGDCDIPGVRDAHTPNESTPFLVVRMHINVFRASDGTERPEDVGASPCDLPQDLSGACDDR